MRRNRLHHCNNFTRIAALLFVILCNDEASCRPLGPLDQRPTAELNQRNLFENEERLSDDPLSVAAQSVESAELEYGADQLEMIGPLLDLARIQESEKAYHSAADSYSKCISIVENHAGFFNTALIVLHSRLGHVYQSAGQFEKSIAAFQRAKHVSHRNIGLYNLQQIEVIDAMIESYYRMGRVKDADREQWYRFRAFEHQYGDDTLRLMPAIFKLADWYHRIGQYENEQYIFKQTLAALHESEVKKNTDLTTPLRAIANRYRVMGYSALEGEKALRLALDIADKDSQITPTRHAEILIDLGDWYLTLGKTKAALENYKRAWQLLFANKDTKYEAVQLFDHPIALSDRRLRRRYSSRVRLRPNYLTQPYHGIPIPQHLPPEESTLHNINSDINVANFVELQLTVNKDGSVADIEVVNTALPEAMKEKIMPNLDRLIYRPRLINGEPVITHQHRSRLFFVDGKAPLKRARQAPTG